MNNATKSFDILAYSSSIL